MKRGRPRFYLQIIPGGGIDSIFTTDPKTAKDVELGIDVPYGSKDIVTTPQLALGPTFANLARWAPRLAIVNSFRQNSANHPTAMVHTTRMKTHGTTSTPALLDALGERRGNEVAANLSLGAPFTTGFSPQYLGEPTVWKFGADPGLLDHIDAAHPEDLAEAARLLELQANRIGAAASAEQKQTRQNLLDSSHFLARAAATPKFAPADWGFELEAQFYKGGRDLQRAMWVFEHGLARCVTTVIGGVLYDSHFSNTARQVPATKYLAQLLDKLFDELDHRVVDGKPLSEQTAVIVGSEIGRFPRLNNVAGKDHLPQAPYLFFGPWFAGGKTYGGSTRQMISVPVSTKSGMPEKGGHLLRLDDIGTTLLALDGANPEVYGYAGERLPFLVEGA